MNTNAKSIILCVSLLVLIAVVSCTADNYIEAQIAVPSSTNDNANQETMSEYNFDTGCNSDAESSTAYSVLKADFESNLEFAISEVEKEISSWTSIFSYLAHSSRLFEEMLNYRQSIDDYPESVELAYVHDGFNLLSIDVGPTFSDGRTNYRIITLATATTLMVQMFIQIFDEETVVSQRVYGYQIEGGVFGEIVYCGFRQEADKLYLIIIHREEVLDGEDGYNLINYEIIDFEATIYSALRENFSVDNWIVYEAFCQNEFLPFKANITRISRTASMHNWSVAYSSASFVDDILTVALENEEHEKISLLFEEGFWVALQPD